MSINVNNFAVRTNLQASNAEAVSAQQSTNGESIFDDKMLILKEKLTEVQDKQGIFGNLWNGFKNATSLGLSSSDVMDAFEKYNDGAISYDEAFETVENFEKKQMGALDLFANMATGMTVAILTAATGEIGAVALGALLGGCTKAGIKITERATNNVEKDALNLKQIAKDTLTGTVNGATTVLTAGMVNNAVAGRSVAAAVKTGIMQGAKAGAISGAAAGSVDYAAETIFEDDKQFDTSEFILITAQSSAFGALLGGAMGGISGGVKQYRLNSTAENVAQTSIADKTHTEQNVLKVNEDTASDISSEGTKIEINGKLKNITEITGDDLDKCDMRTLERIKYLIDETEKNTLDASDDLLIGKRAVALKEQVLVLTDEKYALNDCGTTVLKRGDGTAINAVIENGGTKTQSCRGEAALSYRKTISVDGEVAGTAMITVGERIQGLPSEYGMGYDALGIELLGTSDAYKGSGIALIESVVRDSEKMGFGGRVQLLAANCSRSASLAGSSKAGLTPVPFYWKCGFRSVDESVNKMIEEGIKTLEATGVYPADAPASTLMYLPKDAILKILSK